MASAWRCEAQAEGEVVGEVIAADGNDASDPRIPVAVEDVVGGAAADVEHEHAVAALLVGGDHRAGGEAGEDDLVDLQVEAVDEMNAVGDLPLVAVDSPIADVELAAGEVLRIRHGLAIEAEGAAQVLHHGALGRELLAARQIAHGGDVVAVDEVVGARDVHGALVVETVEVRAGLGKVDAVDAGAGLALGGLDGRVRAIAGRLHVDDGALDHALRGAGAQADDVEAAAAGEFADEGRNLVGADFDCADDSVLRDHDGDER
jgi:hypothetical protein